MRTLPSWIGRHHHLAAVRVDAVGHVFGFEHGHHVAGGDLFAGAEDRLVVGLVLPHEHHDRGGDDDRQHQQRGQVVAQRGRQAGQANLAPPKADLSFSNHVEFSVFPVRPAA
jgi:hypothetical protein